MGRMLAIIGSGECTVDKMSAVTFTRKAASELKGRFQLELEKASRGERDRRKRERYQKALLNLETLFAGTIHSFCARILRERPIEAGLDPDFQELEEEENAILRDRCWSEYLEALHLEKATVLKEVAELGIDPAGLASTYQNIALYPEVGVIRKKRRRPDFKKERKLFEG
ncbi:MAG: UvrD-helicase domain-containing protein [Desulfobacterales bacterium]|nr:UvrD-helicase domain-containing protein [Desulfobacterales bacterium]